MSAETTNTTGSSKRPRANKINSSNEMKVVRTGNNVMEEKLKNWNFEFRAFTFEDQARSTENKNADNINDIIIPMIPKRVRFFDKIQDIIEGIIIKVKGKAKSKNKSDIEK